MRPHQEYSVKNSPNKLPLRGFHDDHPLYVSFAYASLPTEDQLRIDQLVAQIGIAIKVLKLRANRSDDPKLFKSAIKVVLSAVHVISRDQEELSSYPESYLPPRRYIDAVEKIDSDHARKIHHTLACSLGLKGSFTREVEKRSLRHVSLSTMAFRKDHEPGEAPTKEERTIHVYQQENDLIKCRTSLDGCNRQEFDSGRDLISTECGPQDPRNGRTPRQHAILSRQVKTHIAMHNQRLACRIEVLTPF